jgi:hypothetical protein
MSTELDERVRAAERELCRRARERFHEGNSYVIDTRPQITSAAFERANAKAWKICKVCAGLLVFMLMLFTFLGWF